HLVGRKGESHVNRGVIPVLVFHFGFGERGLRTCAPKNRLLRLINEPFLNEYGEGAQDFCLIFGIHRQIRILPIAEDAEPFELFALDVDKLPGNLSRFLRTSRGERPRDSFTTLYSIGSP